MKKLLTFLMFFLLATAMAQMQAETATLSISASVTSSDVTLTDDKQNEWTFTTDGSLTSNNSYIQAGTNTKNVTYLKFVTSAFSGKKITKVQVWGTSKANSNVTAKVIIGTTTIGTSSAYTTQNASSGGTEYSVSNTNNVSGDLKIEISRPSSATGAIYFNKAIVTYEEEDTPTPTTYSVTVADNIANGTVTASPTSAKEGDDVTLTATPASGYEFGSWNVTNASTSATITVTNNKFKMPAANVNVSATFNEVTPGPTPTGGKTFKKITTESELETGANYVILTADGNKAATSINNNKIRVLDSGETTFSLNRDENIVTIPTSSTVEIYALGKDSSSNKWTISDSKGRISSAGSNTNISYANGTFDISYDSYGGLSIVGSSGRLWLYNSTAATPVIGNYATTNITTSGYQMIELYKAITAPVVKTSTTTAFSAEAKAGVTKTVGDADFTEAATLTPNEAGSLTYSSSNTGVATVNATTGVVHIVGVGTTIIKAEFAETDDYKASSDSYTLTVNAATLTSIAISGTPTKTEYKVGEAFSTEGLTVTGTYSNGNSAPITEGIVWTFEPATLAATTTSVAVTATVDGKSANQTYTVSVSKKDASVAIENVEVEVGKTATISATTTPADAELTYTITEGADKISIADGVITGVAEGTATVKAAFAGNDEFNAAETIFTVNVTPKRLVAFINLATTEDISGTPSAELITWEKDGFVVTNAQNGGTAVNNYYPGTNQSSTRLYKNNILTFTPAEGKGITKIEYVATTTGYATTMANSTWSNATASANGTTVTITPAEGTEPVVATIGGTNGGTSFTIYYEDATPVVRTLDHIAVVEGYKAEYTDGDAFEKATVMAYYEEEGVEPVNVTNKATFSGYDLSAETSGEQTVNVSYTEGEVTATTSYTINFTAVTKRTVTIVPPVNGQLKVVVKATGAEIATGARVADGTVIKITNTPDEGYVLRKIVVTDTDKHNYTAQDKEITVNGIDVTINAIFIKGDNFTYTWSVNGQVASQDVYKAGATVTAPAVTAAGPDGKTFVGWSRTATVDADNCTLATVDPTAVTDRTYFAVFATEKTEPSPDGSNVYYEKITPDTYDYGYWSDPNKQYILVYENGSNANVFNGKGQKDGTNYVETSINTTVTPYRIESLPDASAIITMTEWNSNGYKFHVNGSETVIMHTDDSQLNVGVPNEEKVSITEQKFQISCENDSWVVSSLNTWLRFDNRNGNLNFKAADSKTKWNDIQFYVKKNAGTTTYSEYTTGMTVDPHQFQLVTSAGDLVAGREYIIVSKFINDDNSRTIYGLSVDNADSRTENGKEGTSKTTTNFRRGETGVTFSHGDYFASIDNKISVLALEGEEGAWAFNSAAGYLKGGKETEAFLRINSNRANATISKDILDVATIIYKVVKDDEEVDGTREVFLNINGGYPRYGAYAHNNLTDTDKKYDFAASYLYWREALNEESLAEIEANGISGTEYTITDELDVVYVQDNFAWAKDAHGSSYAYRTNEPEYEATWYPVGNSFDTNNYDQSNWIKLVFANSTSGLEAANAIKGKRLNRSAVTGVYTGHKDRFHEIEVLSDLSDNIQGVAPEYTPNVYTMASFWDENIYDYAVAQNDRKFFFMNPKIEEYCIVTEAMWAGSKFVVPSGTTTDGVKLNEAGFDGGFTVDWKLSVDDDQIGDLEAALNASPSNRYTFEAIIVKTEPSLTPKEDGPAKAATAKDVTLGSTHFVAYPIGFNAPGDHIVTDVKDVNVAGREVKSVRYYDVAGRSYGEAQPGINIVVTEYTDGSHSAAKMVR